MPPHIANRGRLAATILALGFAGCLKPAGEIDTLPRRPVSGTVSLNGTPLAEGKIQFDPAGSSIGVSVSAAVKDGKYALEQAQGLVPGKYRVLISSRRFREIKADEVPGGPAKPEPETVPEQYNKKSKLEAEVTASGPNTFPFDLGK